MSAERRRPRVRPPSGARGMFIGLLAVALVAGIAGGLARAGLAVPPPVAAPWLPQAVLAHAFLVMGAFMGTVIAIERAVALKARWAWTPPLLSATSGVLMLAGASRTAAATALAAGALFLLVNLRLLRRQREPHTRLLACGAAAWLAGQALYAAGRAGDAVLSWWFAFLVLTIAAERREMTRLMRRRAGAAAALYALLGLLLGGCALAAFAPAAGQAAFGAALAGLAVWLFAFDIARRTVRARGLSRYMALCLLLGYAWLLVAGLAWAAVGLGHALRDLALHGLGLGFVFSMMLAHAPVILPAVARVKLQFGPHFYLPLALLHGSLLVRLFVPGGLRAGAAGNALALLLFAGTVAGSAIAWRRAHASRASSSKDPDASAAHD